jgi:nucleotide-binding universal stress UspA family protein
MATTASSVEVAAELRRIMQAQTDDEQQTERRVIDGFTRAAESFGVKTEHHIETVGDDDAAVPKLVHYGRMSDMIVLGRAGAGDGSSPDLGLIHDVLFGSGVPIIIVPSPPADGVGRRVMIAWNGSRESARAVKDAMPILQRAEKVDIVCVDQARPGSNVQPGADLAHYLEMHGIPSSIGSLKANGMSVGDTLLAHQHDIGSDFLVMGAYGHSRLREFVLGGVTKRILERTAVPVLMSH